MKRGLVNMGKERKPFNRLNLHRARTKYRIKQGGGGGERVFLAETPKGTLEREGKDGRPGDNNYIRERGVETRFMGSW